MLFIGDIASPDLLSSTSIRKVIEENQSIFSGERIICNFEGLIHNESKLNSNYPVLYNHPSILKALSTEQEHILCLANNHVLDLPGQFETTVTLINKNGFKYCGAGKSIEEAERPIVFSEGTNRVALFNACWDFLLYKHRNPSSGIYVAELYEEGLLKKIIKYKEEFSRSYILVCVHWSLDLETLPFPMYRKFSQDLISAGANLVIGTHSHCVQGGEKIKNGYVIYGLGNFLIPDGKYAGGNLKFPSLSTTELAIEWNPGDDKVLCHWFETKKNLGKQHLKYTGSDNFETSNRLRNFTPYAGMSNAEYLKYYKKNRRKKIFIPVYRDYRQTSRNKFYTQILKNRARIAHFLAKINIINWQN